MFTCRELKVIYKGYDVFTGFIINDDFIETESKLIAKSQKLKAEGNI